MATYEIIDNGSPDGSQWGGAASDKIGFYGITPIIQRAYTSTVHLSSDLTSSATFSAAHLAAMQEVQNTLIALGVWATV